MNNKKYLNLGCGNEKMEKMKFGYYGNFSTTHQTEVYIADALERAGHDVVRLNRNVSILIDCDYVLFAKLSKIDIIDKAKNPQQRDYPQQRNWHLRYWRRAQDI